MPGPRARPPAWGPEGLPDRRAQCTLARVRGGRRARSAPTRGRTAGHVRQAAPGSLRRSGGPCPAGSVVHLGSRKLRVCTRRGKCVLLLQYRARRPARCTRGRLYLYGV
eukprot:15189973-Alexandrium_andersonii.AAC.1